MDDGRKGRWATAAIALALLGYTTLYLLTRAAAPSDGSASYWGHANVRTDGVVVSTAGRGSGGLRDGDVVVAVDGRRLIGVRTTPLDAFSPAAPWQLRTYTVVRDGAVLDVEVAARRYDLGNLLRTNWSTVLFDTTLVVLAIFVFARRPDEPSARVLLLIAALVSACSLPFLAGLEVGDLLGGPGLRFWALNGPLYVAFIVVAATFVLVFPRPLVLSQRRLAVITAAIVAGVASPLAYLAWATVARAETVEWIAGVGGVVSIVEVPFYILVPLGLAIRYRAGTDRDRDQLRVVAASFGAATVGTMALWFVPVLLAGRPLLPWSAIGILGLPIPVAIAWAILRHEAFDVRVVVQRSLVYGALTLVIVTVYVAVLVVLGAVFRQQAGFLTALMATGLVAVLVQPLRDALQRQVNRILFGHRDEPYVALRRLGGGLEASLAPDDVLPAIAASVATALRVPAVAVVAERDAIAVQAAVHGDGREPRPIEVPLAFAGERVGRFEIAPRGPGEALGAADRRLVADLGRVAAGALRVVLLADDLRRSRRRIVTSREEERRRIRREILDALGPVLDELPTRLERARARIADDPAAARLEVEVGRGRTETAIAEIRRIVYDLRPPALDELGLVAAVRQRVATQRDGSGLGGAVDVEAVGHIASLPAAVEVAAYRIAVSAAENIAIVPGGTCRVRLAVDPTELRVAVEASPPGTLSSPGTLLEELAGELGGAIAVEPAADATRVLARLPLPA